MALNCATLKCFGCDDFLYSKEDVSASVQPSSPQAVILKAAASSIQGAGRCTALVWISPYGAVFSLILIQSSARMQESAASRTDPPVNKPLSPSDSNSQKTKVLRLCITTQLWENAGMERDGEKHRGREDRMSAHCLHPGPAAWRRHLQERGLRGVEGDRPPCAEGPEVCGECEWYA